jgi:hypothetical protein
MPAGKVTHSGTSVTPMSSAVTGQESSNHGSDTNVMRASKPTTPSADGNGGSSSENQGCADMDSPDHWACRCWQIGGAIKWVQSQLGLEMIRPPLLVEQVRAAR